MEIDKRKYTKRYRFLRDVGGNMNRHVKREDNHGQTE